METPTILFWAGRFPRSKHLISRSRTTARFVRRRRMWRRRRASPFKPGRSFSRRSSTTRNIVAREDSLIEQNEDPQRRSDYFSTCPRRLAPCSRRIFELPKINNQIVVFRFCRDQSIYEGGRMLSAVRSARLINEQAVLAFQSIVADTLLSVSTAYDDVFRAANADPGANRCGDFSARLSWPDSDKYNAGSLPEFDVLRQATEVGNAEAAARARDRRSSGGETAFGRITRLRSCHQRHRMIFR